MKNEKDFYSGLLFVVIGGAFAYGSINYPVGSTNNMGPGYFPMVLGWLLMVLGVVISMTGLIRTPAGGSENHKVGTWAWRPLTHIIGANLFFGVLLCGLPSIGLPSFGLITAVFGLILIASGAKERLHVKESLIVATGLSFACYLIFIVFIDLPIPLWPIFLLN